MDSCSKSNRNNSFFVCGLLHSGGNIFVFSVEHAPQNKSKRRNTNFPKQQAPLSAVGTSLLTTKVVRLMKGKADKIKTGKETNVYCLNGHSMLPGTKFCSECGARPEVTSHSTLEEQQMEEMKEVIRAIVIDVLREHGLIPLESTYRARSSSTDRTQFRPFEDSQETTADKLARLWRKVW